MRRKPFVSALLALLGSALLIWVLVWASGGATSKTERGVIYLAAAAALIGWLNLIVLYLTYQLEARRVPRPDVFVLQKGQPTKRLHFEIPSRDPPPDDFTDEVAAERERVLAPMKSRDHRESSLIFRSIMTYPSEEDWKRYGTEVEPYLNEYEAYLEEHAKYDELRGLTLELSLQFTNEHAAVPANGLRARLTFPGKEQGILITRPDDFPKEPTAPSRPSVPKPTNLFAGIDPSLYMSRFPRTNPNIADLRLAGTYLDPKSRRARKS